MDHLLWCPFHSTQALFLAVIPAVLPCSSPYLSLVVSLMLLDFILEIFRDEKHAALRAHHCQMLLNWIKI